MKTRVQHENGRPDVTVRPHSNFKARTRRNILTSRCVWLVFAFLFASVGPAAAQTDPCQSIKNEINSLRTELQNRKKDFQDDGEGPVRHPNAAQIRKLENEYRPRIAAKQRAYDQCRFNHGGKPDQSVTFSGTATMTTSNTNAAGPFVQNLPLALTYLKYDHTTLEINNFPTIVVGPFTTPVGPNTTTVTLVGVPTSTSVTPGTGRMSIQLTLHFKHTLAGAGDSDLPITLSTESTGGSRINHNNRQVTLAGTGTFSGGFLGGSTCTLIISGTLSALP